MTQAPAIPLPRSCEVSQKFFFDAAHTLKRTVDYAEEIAGSRRIHGHTYHSEVTVTGSADADTGMVVDLGHLRNAIQVLRPQLDHHLLDEVEGLGPATLENLAAFIWRAMAAEFPGLSQVRVWRDGIGDSCTLRAH
jgi:6-pyruvoyltetrahydropterin/6-carboxytetrahydropterin synthase